MQKLLHFFGLLSVGVNMFDEPSGNSADAWVVSNGLDEQSLFMGL
jgi:hypothetical protein